MTTGTLDRQAHEGRSHGCHTINNISGVTFLGQGRPYIDNEVQSVEPRSNHLILRWTGIEISCKLMGDEGIKRKILIESPDDPVAVWRHIAVMVMVKPVGIGKAD